MKPRTFRIVATVAIGGLIMFAIGMALDSGVIGGIGYIVMMASFLLLALMWLWARDPRFY
jgi:hypothetical protein